MENSSLFHSNLVSTSRILYTPSIFAKNSLIYLQEIGSLKAQKTHTSKRENLSSYLFFIVKSGAGTLEYDGNVYKLKKGDCVFIDCRRSYSHRTSENLWHLNWAHFYGSNMSQIYEKYTERGGRPCFHPKNLQDYEILLQSIYEIADSNDYVKDMLIYEKIISLLTLLMKESWHPELSKLKPASAKKQNLLEVKDYIDMNYKEKITLDDLSKKFFINKFYLTRIFKEQFGISVNNYIIQIRITHAKQLLRFSNLSIEAIGSECGMNDPNYFSRMFKQIEGMSPGEFRKTW